MAENWGLLLNFLTVGGKSREYWTSFSLLFGFLQNINYGSEKLAVLSGFTSNILYSKFRQLGVFLLECWWIVKWLIIEVLLNFALVYPKLWPRKDNCSAWFFVKYPPLNFPPNTAASERKLVENPVADNQTLIDFSFGIEIYSKTKTIVSKKFV